MTYANEGHHTALDTILNVLKEVKVKYGAYSTMIKRIESVNIPNFFFMYYDISDLRVKNLIKVQKHSISKHY